MYLDPHPKCSSHYPTLANLFQRPAVAVPVIYPNYSRIPRDHTFPPFPSHSTKLVDITITIDRKNG